jgi:hypothetical protein
MKLLLSWLPIIVIARPKAYLLSLDHWDRGSNPTQGLDFYRLAKIK